MAKGYPKKKKFVPQNKEKYVGNVDLIIARSNLELRFMRWCDTHSSVIRYSSEEVIIPYIKPTDKMYHRYFVDFLLTIRDKDDVEHTYLVEIKPKSQTKPPRKSKNKTNRAYLTETATFLVNKAKFAAAEKYCEQRGWKWKVLTEDQLKTL